MRVIFMGTPDFAVATLLEIIGQGHEVVAAYTRAPQPAGRGMDLRPSPVEREARRFGIEVQTPKSLRGNEAAELFARHAADVAVVVAYGMILPKSILDIPPLGCLNLHGSLLPRWRGAAPINRAVMAGDAESGVCVMRMEEGLDTGPVGLAERVAIGADMTAGQLHDVLARLGADAMVRALAALARGGLRFTAQPEAGVTYAHKIEKSDSRIDWNRQAGEVHNHCRGLSPFPGAWFELATENGPVRVKALQTTRADGSGAPGTALDDHLTIACRDGAIKLLTVQRAGKQPMTAPDFLRGTPVRAGTQML